MNTLISQAFWFVAIAEEFPERAQVWLDAADKILNAIEEMRK